MFHAGDHQREYLKGTRRHGSPRFPVKKFLRSRLGQIWDKVHSELSQKFDRRTYAGYKFWNSLDYYLTEKVWIGAETGRVYETCAYSGSRQVDGFYVHPWTNKLCFQPRLITLQYINKCTCANPKVPLNSYTHLYTYMEKIEGIWYYIECEPSYVNEWAQAKKRQLTTEELLGYELTNSAEEWISRECDHCALLFNRHSHEKCAWCDDCKFWGCLAHRNDPTSKMSARLKMIELKAQKEEANELSS